MEFKKTPTGNKTINRSLLIVFFLLSRVVIGYESGPGSESPYTLEELDSTGNILRVVIDGGAKNLSAPCRVKRSKAKVMIQSVHSKLDWKMARAAEKLTAERIEAWTSHCEENCHCGVYSDILERAQRLKLVHFFINPESINSLATRASSETFDQALACAKRNQAFCRSDLFSELKK